MLCLQNGSASSQIRQSSSTGKDSTKTGAKGPKSAASSTSTQRASIEINSANFPPLQNSHSSPDDGPVPTPGYQGPFLKYSFDDIINIVKDIKDPSLPASIKPVSERTTIYLSQQSLMIGFSSCCYKVMYDCPLIQILTLPLFSTYYIRT
jgi:hypothetical protein